MRSGSSYLSQSELVLTFGLGQKAGGALLQIEWPSGQVDKVANISAGQTITVEEGKGIVFAKKFASGEARVLKSTPRALR